MAVAVATPVLKWLTAWAIQQSALHQVAQRRCPNHSSGCTPVRFLGSPPLAKPLPETATHIEGFLLAQHVVARSRQLVRQSLGRQDAIGLALLAFIEALGWRAVAASEVGCFYEGPG